MQSGYPSSTPTTSLADRRWWQVALAAGILAAVVNLVIYAGATGPGGLSLDIPTAPNSPNLSPLTPGAVALMSVLPALLAGALAAGLARWTATPRRWFLAIAVAGLVVSLVPVLGGALPAATKVVLTAMHVVAAAVIAGLLAARLPDRGGRG